VRFTIVAATAAIKTRSLTSVFLFG
jgi:hypothetical protein